MQNVQQELFARLDAIAAKLGLMVGQLWAVLIRQQYVAFFQELLLTVFMLVVVVMLGRFIKTMVDKDNPHVWEGKTVIAVIVFTIVALVGTIQIFSFFNQFDRIFNPEYRALQTLMALLK